MEECSKSLLRDTMLMKYCKICKTFVADSELIKRWGRKVLKVNQTERAWSKACGGKR